MGIDCILMGPISFRDLRWHRTARYEDTSRSSLMEDSDRRAVGKESPNSFKYYFSHPDGEATTKKSTSMPSPSLYPNLHTKVVDDSPLDRIFRTQAGLELASQCKRRSLKAHIELVKDV